MEESPISTKEGLTPFTIANTNEPTWDMTLFPALKTSPISPKTDDFHNPAKLSRRTKNRIEKAAARLADDKE